MAVQVVATEDGRGLLTEGGAWIVLETSDTVVPAEGGGPAPRRRRQPRIHAPLLQPAPPVVANPTTHVFNIRPAVVHARAFAPELTVTIDAAPARHRVEVTPEQIRMVELASMLAAERGVSAGQVLDAIDALLWAADVAAAIEAGQQAAYQVMRQRDIALGIQLERMRPQLVREAIQDRDDAELVWFGLEAKDHIDANPDCACGQPATIVSEDVDNTGARQLTSRCRGCACTNVQTELVPA